MPEAAEAQLKVANIHYQEMEKPDRDFTHAMRAEEEYRALIQEYPDSKLVPLARQRLREVQEVLAEREFEVGRFYYLRLSYPAAIARLKTLVDRYPLYSGADEALFLIGQSYEREIDVVRKNPRSNEVIKTKMIDELTKEAADAYDKIITRYPAMYRGLDAKARLEALHQSVPRPTRAALDQNKREEASRQESGTLLNMLNGFEKHPDVAKAARVGDPTMVDPEPATAMGVVRDLTKAGLAGGDNKLTVQTINGKPAANEPAPRSDAGTAAVDPSVPTPGDQPSPQGPAAAELKPNVADPNELKPNVAPDPTALPPLQQNNELDMSNGTPSSASASTSTSSKNTEMADISSSKKKKKKGLAKLNPF